jgi:hypothetical protein
MAAAALLQQNVATICISLSRHRARVTSTSTALTKYKEQSQRNIRDLYDKVQESLITTGFGEAATLRGTFSREGGGTSETRSQDHWQRARQMGNKEQGELGVWQSTRTQSRDDLPPPIAPLPTKSSHKVSYYPVFFFCCRQLESMTSKTISST